MDLILNLTLNDVIVFITILLAIPVAFIVGTFCYYFIRGFFGISRQEYNDKMQTEDKVLVTFSTVMIGKFEDKDIPDSLTCEAGTFIFDGIAAYDMNGNLICQKPNHPYIELNGLLYCKV